MNKCTEDQFLKDVSAHKMTVILDSGVHRHIRFIKQGNGNMWFEIVTWPGRLCISGDMGTYTFSRIDDMFRFFRMDLSDFNFLPDSKLQINKGYWAGKVTSISCFGGGVKIYSAELFEQAVKSYFNDWFENADDGAAKQECWEEIESNVLNCTENEYVAINAAMDFNHGDFHMHDSWEFDLREYTYYYVWCLYAIVWGISQFDAVQAKAA